MSISLEAVQALEGESERSSASAVLVNDYAAACCGEWWVSFAVYLVLDTCRERGGGRGKGLPACFPPKPLVHMRPIVACFVVVLSAC
jgi:hypothetical protein